MAKVEVKTEETRCDRCGRKVSDNGGARILTPLGPASTALDGSADDIPTIDLCLQCSRSLEKWWARGKAGDE